jgi:hypothetical protein
MEGTPTAGPWWPSVEEAEESIVARWRALDDDLKEPSSHGKHNVLLFAVLSAVPRAPPSAAPAGSATQDEHSDWAEAVRVLFWWVFVCDGPHACLSFLDNTPHEDPSNSSPHNDKLQRGDDEGALELEVEKKELFVRLGPALLWGDPQAREWDTIIPPTTAGETFRRLLARLRQACQAGEERACTVVLKCLACVLGASRIRPECPPMTSRLCYTQDSGQAAKQLLSGHRFGRRASRPLRILSWKCSRTRGSLVSGLSSVLSLGSEAEAGGVGGREGSFRSCRDAEGCPYPGTHACIMPKSHRAGTQQ